MARVTQLNKTAIASVNADTLEPVYELKDRFTRDVPRVDNFQPELYIKHLIPNGLNDIKLTKLAQPVSSNEILLMTKKLGFSADEYILPIYSASKIGRPRTLSNSELVRGNPFYGTPQDPLTESLPKIKKARAYIQEFTKHMISEANKLPSPVMHDEVDDAMKFSWSRTTPYGRHLNPPAAEWLLGVVYNADFMKVFDEVIDHYFDSTEHIIPAPRDAYLLMTDAKETSVGAPSFASGMVDDSGFGYHEKRLFMLADMPVPDFKMDPEMYLNTCYDWGSALGLPDPAMTFSAALSYRTKNSGNKDLLLWNFYKGQFLAFYSAMCMEDGSREVFPASFPFNILMTPAVWQLKTFRKNKLGMDHRPEKYVRYIDALNRQGKYSWESDFSNFDKSISAFLMSYAADRFARRKGKNAWHFAVLREFFKSTGAIYPSFLTDEQGHVTFFKGATTLLSGTLSTSEIGSLVSVAANLYALKSQIKDVVQLWKAGKFVILVQSDDVLFTTDKKLDMDEFYARMMVNGLKCKLKEGNMFLKKLLPVGTLRGYKFPVGGAPLMERQPQQTFANENDYSGKPDAVIRLALLSRAQGLDTNPISSPELIDHWKSILSDFPIFQPVIDVLFQGVLALSPEDQKAVFDYATSEEGATWISQLVARIDADPKAALTLQSLNGIGFDLGNYNETAISQRRSYIDQLFKQPTSESRSMLRQICKWTNG